MFHLYPFEDFNKRFDVPSFLESEGSGKNYFTHCEVLNMATKQGFYAKDLFIYVAKNRITDIPIDEQQHARKFHSYFWVFQKRKSKVKYTNNSDIEPPEEWFEIKYDENIKQNSHDD